MSSNLANSVSSLINLLENCILVNVLEFPTLLTSSSWAGWGWVDMYWYYTPLGHLVTSGLAAVAGAHVQWGSLPTGSGLLWEVLESETSSSSQGSTLALGALTDTYMTCLRKLCRWPSLDTSQTKPYALNHLASLTILKLLFMRPKYWSQTHRVSDCRSGCFIGHMWFGASAPQSVEKTQFKPLDGEEARSLSCTMKMLSEPWRTYSKQLPMA